MSSAHEAETRDEINRSSSFPPVSQLPLVHEFYLAPTSNIILLGPRCAQIALSRREHFFFAVACSMSGKSFTLRRLLRECRHVFGGKCRAARCLIVTPGLMEPQDLVEAAVAGGAPRERVECVHELTEEHLAGLEDAYIDEDGVLHSTFLICDDVMAATPTTRSSLEKVAVYYTHHMHLCTIVSDRPLTASPPICDTRSGDTANADGQFEYDSHTAHQCAVRHSISRIGHSARAERRAQLQTPTRTSAIVGAGDVITEATWGMLYRSARRAANTA